MITSPEKLEWKESLVKSLIYRVFTVLLGFLTVYIITQDIYQALGAATLTELVQFIFYFVYEVLWTNYITRKRLEKKIRSRLIDIEINYKSVMDLAYKMSRIETFVKDIYDSTLDFFYSILKNEELKEFHPEITKYYEYFLRTHKGKSFASDDETTKKSVLEIEKREKKK